MSKFTKHQEVEHDFSGESGEILAVVSRGERYKYFVLWETGTADWYEESVLQLPLMQRATPKPPVGDKK